MLHLGTAKRSLIMRARTIAIVSIENYTLLGI